MSKSSPTYAPTATGDSRSLAAAPTVGVLATQLAGLGHLLRLLLRLDRVRLTLWFIGIVGLIVATCQSVIGLYGTQAELDSYGALVRDNAALIVQAGPGYGLDDPTLGAVLMNELAIWVIIAVGLMSLFTVVRHTRTAEDTERAELLRAAPLGRHTSMVATLIEVAIANLLVAIGAAATLIAFGLPTVGSLAFGTTLLFAGMLVAAVGAVTAQVANGARSALGLGGIFVAVAFVVRAVGDVGDGRLSWASPIGWAQAIRAFAGERWWVLLLQLAATCVLVLLAVSLEARRDHGAGLLTQRLGRPEATGLLASPLALAIRIQRGSVVGWSVGLGLLGFFYGIVADQAASIIDENPDMEDFFAQLGEASVTDAFLSTSVLVLAVIATGFSVASVLRLHREEVSTHADVLLATPTSRRRWAWSHLAVAFGGTMVVLAVTGLGMGIGYAAMTGEIRQVPELFVAAVVMAPGLFVVSAATATLLGLAPKLAPAAWSIVVFAFVVSVFGQVLNLPQWVRNVSPLEHVPALPAEAFDVVPISLLVATAVALTIAALAALDRRDIARS